MNGFAVVSSRSPLPLWNARVVHYGRDRKGDDAVLFGSIAAMVGILYMLFVCNSITHEATDKALRKQTQEWL